MDFFQYNQEMLAHYYRAGVYHSIKDPQNDYTSGNHHVLNATHYLVLKKLAEGNVLAQVVMNADRTEAQDYIESTKDVTGVFNRAPTKLEQNAHDDQIAIAVTSNVLNLQYGKYIYDYGNQFRFPKFKGIPIPIKWYYDNTEETPEFDIRCWFGRFFWTVSVFKASAKVKLNIIDKLAYAAYLLNDVYFDKDKTATSGKILKWLANDVMKGQSSITDWAIKKWEDHIKEMYPEQMGEVLAIYHGSTHPFAEAMRGRM